MIPSDLSILPPRMREMVILRRDGMRHAAIAQRLGVTVGCVARTLHNAKNRKVALPKPTKAREYPGDEWFARNVALVRTMGETRRERYLNAFGSVWGLALRERLERSL